MGEIGKWSTSRLRITGDGVITWSNTSAGNVNILDTRISGDVHARFILTNDGRMKWGPGNVNQDCEIRRSAANKLICLDRLKLSGNFFESERAATTDEYLYGFITGDTNPRIQIMGDGSIEIGPGNAATDCVVARRAANIINTPDRLEVGSLGFGNSSAGGAVGTCVAKAEVFNATGSSIGYLPIYDNIS